MIDLVFPQIGSTTKLRQIDVIEIAVLKELID